VVRSILELRRYHCEFVVVTPFDFYDVLIFGDIFQEKSASYGTGNTVYVFKRY